MILLLLACAAPTPVAMPEPLDCSVPLTAEVTVHEGFQGGEDLALVEGDVVSVDRQGRLTRRSFGGAETVIASGLGEIAGLVALPDGSFVLADVLSGSLVQVRTDGGVRTVLSGLAYPNGLAVVGPDTVVVSEQSDGRVSRVTVSTGSREVLAQGLDRPNGVAVDASGIVYVTSFGGATVTRIDGVAERFGDVALSVPTTPCEADGSWCLVGDALGVCADGVCEPYAPSCVVDGELCTSEVLGAPVESRCTQGLCPFTPLDQVDACAGRAAGEACGTGTCRASEQGVLVCDLGVGPSCDGQTVGEACVVNDGVRPFFGTCLDFGTTLACRPPELEAVGGGLDGLEVDPCGGVWATEFETGALHHWSAEGGRSTVVEVLPSTWIPNLVWAESGRRLLIGERGAGALYEVRVRP